MADEINREQVLALFDSGLLSDDFISRDNYLRNMKRGFQPQKPPKPYSICDDYQARYKWHQQALREEEKERQWQRESRVR